MKRNQLIIGTLFLMQVLVTGWFLLPDDGTSVSVATLLKRKSSVSLGVLLLLLGWETLTPFFPFAGVSRALSPQRKNWRFQTAPCS